MVGLTLGLLVGVNAGWPAWRLWFLGLLIAYVAASIVLPVTAIAVDDEDRVHVRPGRTFPLEELAEIDVSFRRFVLRSKEDGRPAQIVRASCPLLQLAPIPGLRSLAAERGARFRLSLFRLPL